MWIWSYGSPVRCREDQRLYIQMSHLCCVISTILVVLQSEIPYLVPQSQQSLLFVCLLSKLSMRRLALTHVTWKSGNENWKIMSFWQTGHVVSWYDGIKLTWKFPINAERP